MHSGRIKQSEKQGKEGKVYPIKHRVSKNRREKTAFFSEQCLIIEENNKRGKTRDLFRKIRNIKGILPQNGHNKG